MDTNALKQIHFLESVCGICGEAHHCSECTLIEVKRHVLDKIIPTKARLTLPDFLSLETMADGSYSIVANIAIEKGTKFGPLEAPKLFTLNPNIIFPLKLFNSGMEDLSEYYLDTCDENNCNWMIFITSAQTAEEQNLICYQEKSEIYYVAIKDIRAGEFLKVWYSHYYAKRMKQNVLTDMNMPNDCCDNNIKPNVEPINLDLLIKKQEKLAERENWTCKFCGKLESDVALFANHILEHYSKKTTIKYCSLCKESFTTQKKLKRHVEKNHKKELDNLSNNAKLTEASLHKTEDKDMLVGDPLLNVLINDSLDNTNLAMPAMELNQMSVTLGNTLESQNLLLESDSLNLNVDNLITENVKELDHFNFEIGESQEQYVCDVCLKSFSKLPYLTQHLRKHTGRYTCHYCLKVFCRRENLDSHKCSNSKMPQFNCSLCERSFMLKKYLVRHVNGVHNKKHTCENCNKQYNSNKEYLEHNCSAVPDSCKTTFSCVTCNKQFFREVYLKKHLKIHERRKQKLNLPTQDFICEICALRFKTKKGLQTHKQTHSEPMLGCKICNKKFHRLEALNTHKLSHENTMVTCPVCNAKLKTRQNLSLHLLQHTGVKSHKCEMCSKAFYQRSGLVSHVRKTHSNKTCHTCNKTFTTKELLIRHKVHHFQEFYECPLCNKTVKLRSSLKKHLKKSHPEQKVNDIMLKIKPKSTNLKLNKDIDMGRIDSNDNNNEQMSTAYNNTMINANLHNLSNMTFGNDVLNNITKSDMNKMSNEEVNIHNIENITSETEQENLETIVNNFENMINDYNSNDESNLLIEGSGEMTQHGNQERMLDFNDFEIDLDSNFGLQQSQTITHDEINLSMPDLLETDQDIALSDNAYILENGNVVEPKEGSRNIILYIVK